MRRLFAVMVVMLTILWSSAAFADNGNFFKVSVGIKGWYNGWTESVDWGGGPRGGSSDSTNMGGSLMLGPSVNIKIGKGFITGSYLKSTGDYAADNYDLYNSTSVYSDSFTIKRTDTDFALGFMPVSHFGFFIGYKEVDSPWTASPLNAGMGSFDRKFKGPGIGLLFNAPMGRAAAFYGNLAYMKLKQTFDNAPGFDEAGFSAELGVAFAMAEGVSANVGIKGQLFSGDQDNGLWTNTWYDNFAGLSFGANYTF